MLGHLPPDQVGQIELTFYLDSTVALGQVVLLNYFQVFVGTALCVALKTVFHFFNAQLHVLGGVVYLTFEVVSEHVLKVC